MINEQMVHGPRAYQSLTEQERRERAARTSGEPVLDFSSGAVCATSTPYVDYHNVDTLLSLQHPRTQEPAELSFYVMGQVQELLFKLLFTEINRVRDLLFAGQVDEALWYLRRVERSQRVLLATWEPLSTITASEFVGFRDQLGTASGIQSYMYRQLEFSLGNKSEEMARAHQGIPRFQEQVDMALRAPSVYDAALALLHSRGSAIPEECVRRDFSLTYVPNSAIERAWADIYREPHRSRDLYLLAEALTDVGHQYSQWRSAHLLTVERVLGNKPGTGGTMGVAWLRRIAEHRFFPELLSARSLL
ncbi:tryptophan 2,3-dioxygenase [Amycolatopsis speibonae]|uniref:Tryptophan 2,3-dioxygenase n=1 Tax=Amycolatopsis speibonae TaxID=1450224 RepID=A0ABV7P230_9PSEU